MRICFIRHASDIKSRYLGENTPLSIKGKRQIRNAVEYYAKENIKAIYTSPCKRAVETAEVIAKRFDLPVYVLPELNERVKFDYKKGSPEEKEFMDNYLNYNFDTDKFESCKKFIDRNFVAFDTIIKNHYDKNENVMIVGHSATLYALNTYFTGIPKNKQIIWLQCGNCSMIKYEKL